MDSRLHGNDGKKPPRKEGDQKVKGEGTFLSPALSPPERMEIRKKERERRERYPNAAAANATATTGGQECPPSVGCPPPDKGGQGEKEPSRRLKSCWLPPPDKGGQGGVHRNHRDGVLGWPTDKGGQGGERSKMNGLENPFSVLLGGRVEPTVIPALLLSSPLLLSFPRKRESIFTWQGGCLAYQQTDGCPDGFPLSRE